ncbi:MAG: hypothetical protein SCL54_09215 [Bacillota bacterium]|nr:hypothetical protein [Bacillota bacterium]
MKNLRQFMRFLKQKPSILWPSLLVSLLYGLFYYSSIGYLYFESHTVGLLKVPNMGDLLLKTRAPFLWEPTLRVYTGFGMTIDLSVINVLIMIFLIIIAFLNIALLVTSIKMPKVCSIGSKTGRLASMLPAFLSGFACCAPTFVILWVSVFGGVATSFLAIVRWALPFAIILLVVGAWKGLRQLDFSQS